MIMIPDALLLIYPEAQFQGETILDAAIFSLIKLPHFLNFLYKIVMASVQIDPPPIIWNTSLGFCMKREKYFAAAESLASKPTLWKQHLVPHLTSVVMKNQRSQIMINTEISKSRTSNNIEYSIARIRNSFSACPSVRHKNPNHFS